MMNGTPTNIALKKNEFLASPSDKTDSLELDLEQGAGEEEIDKSVDNGVSFETPRESFAYIDKDEEEEMNRNSIIISDNERMPSFVNTIVPEKAKSESSFIASLEDLQAVPELDRMDTKMRLRMKSVLYVTDLSQKLNDPSKTKSVYQKSQLYLGLLFIISIFYSLPVLQMVFRFFVFQSSYGHPLSILIPDFLLSRVSLETKTYVTTMTFAGNILHSPIQVPVYYVLFSISFAQETFGPRP